MRNRKSRPLYEQRESMASKLLLLLTHILLASCIIMGVMALMDAPVNSPLRGAVLLAGTIVIIGWLSKRA